MQNEVGIKEFVNYHIWLEYRARSHQFNGNFMKPLIEICKFGPFTLEQMIFTWNYKDHRNWRQLLKTPPIDVCELLEGKSFQHQFYKEYFKGLMSQLPGLPRKCPIQPGPYFTVDEPIRGDKYSKQRTDVDKKFMVDVMNLPNGVYRISIEVSANDEPKAAYIFWQYEIKNRLNFGNF